MKQLKKTLIACLMAVMICIMPAATPLSAVVTAQAAAIGLSKTSVTLYIGNTTTLTLKGTTAAVVWSSADASIATVTKTGQVKGVSKGSTVIKAVCANKTYECKVTVKSPVLSSKSISLETGETQELTLKGASTGVVWYSSNPTVALVTSDGFVIAGEEGTAVIVAKYYGKKYRCTINVVDKALHASVEEITVYDETVITLTSDDDSVNEKISVEVEDPSIVSYELSGWVGYDMYMTITPLKPGSTTITVTSNRNDEAVTIEVTSSTLQADNEDGMSAKEVYKYCNDSVVEVETDQAIGTGFFIDDNLIVTNYHVINGAQEIKVTTYDKKEHNILYVMGYDETLDIAILAIDETYEPLVLNQHVIEVGETVYTLGSSLGLTDTFSNGIVSNVSRYLDSVEYVQTNAAISKGNSGSPLLNEYGEVLGIITLYYDGGQNLNFAISIEQLYQVSVANPLTVTELYNSTHTASSGISISDPDAEIVYEDPAVSNAIGTCQTVTKNQYMYGTVSGVPIDYYKFVLTEDTSLFQFYGFPVSGEYQENSDLYFAILDSSGTVYGYAGEAYDAGTYYQYIGGALSAGTYYIAAYTMDSVTTDISYGFYISY